MFAAGQGEQDVAPAPEEYVGETQAVHVELVTCSYPGMQRQSEMLLLPPEGPVEVWRGQLEHILEPGISEYVPVGQIEQPPLRTTSLYVPVTHSVQSVPLTPSYPMGQRQSCSVELSDGEIAFRGQAKQLSADVAANSDEYVSGPHA